MDLSITRADHGDRTVVRLGGEIDVYTAPFVREKLDEQINAGRADLVVDLSDVTFLDSTGLGVLVGRLKIARTRGGSLRLVGTAERVLRVFAITGLDKVFEANRLDGLVAPTGAPAWVIDPVSGDHFVGGNSTPAAVAGYPSLSVPMGFVFGLPVGLTFIGRAWSEALLVKLAYAYERETRHRKPPRFLATAELPRPA